MKYIFYITVVICIFCELSIAQTMIYVNPANQQITTENSVVININIDSVANLKSYSVKLLFDNSVIEFSGINNGGFLNNSGSNQTFFATQPSASNIVDNFTVNEAILPDFPSGDINTVSGNGTLFSIQFSILESATSIITIENVILKDSSNNIMPVDFSSGSITVLLPIKTKVFFEGPFSIDKMHTNLNLIGALPLNQPYSISPWNYSGNENVASGFFSSHPNIVDWVLIELRTGLAQSSTVGSQAAFILEDGSIVGLDGISPIYFEQSAGNYNIVITHRNHLSIMTPGLQTIERASGVYDFSSSQVNALGALPMVELAAGIYGMYAGDANSDGQLTGTDFNIYNPDFRSAVSGYRITDFNLDGSVTGSDFNLFNPNFRNAKSSFVPK